MSDQSSWSLSVGRWGRVLIRVHALFIATAIVVAFLATSQPLHDAAPYGLAAVVILAASVLVHEAGHCLAAARLGGNPDQIVLGPLGGLLNVEVPREREAELVTALAGPLANLAVVLITLPLLLAADLGVAGLISPLHPEELLDGAWWAVALKLVFWTNGMLAVINLLPAYPLDGARALRALLWPTLEPRVAGHVAVRASRFVALGLCVVAWFVSEEKCAGVLPAWVPLALLATFIYFKSNQEAVRVDDSDWDEELFNYDFSQGYTSLERAAERPRPRGSLRRWLASRRELRRRRRLSLEQDEERQVDDILLRLHEHGMDGLTAKERALLHRVSARYRNRQSN